MTIWTSKAALIVGIGLLGLAGCSGVPGTGGPAPGVSRGAPQTIAVANRSVVIGGPSGYCIDRGGSRLGGDTAFVLLGSCASISRNASVDAPEIPGLLTASVDTQSGDRATNIAVLDQFAGLLDTDAGRAALARDGRAGSVEVFGTLREDGALFIHLSDTSKDAAAGLDPTYWRGLFDLNGRLITVSVVSFANKPLSAGEGLATLRAFLGRIHSETRVQLAAKSPAISPDTRKKLFPGLFN